MHNIAISFNNIILLNASQSVKYCTDIPYKSKTFANILHKNGGFIKLRNDIIL